MCSLVATALGWVNKMLFTSITSCMFFIFILRFHGVFARCDGEEENLIFRPLKQSGRVEIAFALTFQARVASWRSVNRRMPLRHKWEKMQNRLSWCGRCSVNKSKNKPDKNHLLTRRAQLFLNLCERREDLVITRIVHSCGTWEWCGVEFLSWELWRRLRLTGLTGSCIKSLKTIHSFSSHVWISLLWENFSPQSFFPPSSKFFLVKLSTTSPSLTNVKLGIIGGKSNQMEIGFYWLRFSRFCLNRSRPQNRRKSITWGSQTIEESFFRVCENESRVFPLPISLASANFHGSIWIRAGTWSELCFHLEHVR